MSNSWLTHRSWQFVADMNGDGAITVRDVWPWLKWLYFLPGDLLIAFAGPTAVGRFLELTPASLGGPVSAGVSFLLWWTVFWLVLHLVFGLLDVILNIRAHIVRAGIKLRMFLGDREYRKGVMIDWRGERERAREAHHAQRQQERRAEEGSSVRRRWLAVFYALAFFGAMGLIVWALSG